LTFLAAHQKEFNEAALQVKRKGEVNQAKEYLRLAKRFDPLTEASDSDLPVDIDTVSGIQNLFLHGVTGNTIFIGFLSCLAFVAAISMNFGPYIYILL
jgi:hypothetical protein